ncbi:hypothetical protein [Microbulbifer sp. SAOS-129_SWC]|uniref:hypothetical protein n=1 Tax=Microbulbifer sp. SAOS-129_SWC TaxID=3145235 RepID=UPI0032173612
MAEYIAAQLLVYPALPFLFLALLAALVLQILAYRKERDRYRDRCKSLSEIRVTARDLNGQLFCLPVWDIHARLALRGGGPDIWVLEANDINRRCVVTFDHGGRDHGNY